MGCLVQIVIFLATSSHIKCLMIMTMMMIIIIMIIIIDKLLEQKRKLLFSKVELSFCFSYESKQKPPSSDRKQPKTHH